MNTTYASNLVLWSIQGFLALFFFSASAPKLLARGLERWTGFSDLPRAQVVFIGIAETLGAAGLVLPMATGVVPWVTPLAAIGLGAIVLMAAGFHLRADERLEALETGLWTAICALVAIGRWDLLAAGFAPPPSLIIAGLGLLVPAAIVNVVVLVRRPVRGTPAARPPAGAAQAR